MIYHIPKPYPMQDVYVSDRLYEYYTPEDIEYYEKLEKKWRASLPRLSLYQLLEEFPQAHGVVRKILRGNIKHYQSEIGDNRDNLQKINNLCDVTQRWFYNFCEEWAQERIKALVSKIKRATFFLIYLRDNTNKKLPVSKSGVNEKDVLLAKEVPIHSFFPGELKRFGNTLKGLCPFHSDSLPSFCIYENQNRWWCYGESKGGDSIDFVQLLRGCNMPEAVKFLINK